MPSLFRQIREVEGERDRFKKERDQLLFKLAEILGEEALEDALQKPLPIETDSRQGG